MLPRKALPPLVTLSLLCLLALLPPASTSVHNAYAQGGTDLATQVATSASGQSGESRIVFVDSVPLPSGRGIDGMILNPDDKSRVIIPAPPGQSILLILLSPNGRSVVAMTTDYKTGKNGAGLDNIFTMDIDGSHLHQLTHGTISASSDIGYSNYPFGWFPDSKQILYINTKYQAGLYPTPDRTLVTALFIASADGSDQPHQIQPDSPVVFRDSKYIEFVALSPDGHQILFRAIQSTDNNTKVPATLFTMDIDGKNVMPFKQTYGNQSYSPDGKHLVHSVYDSKTTSIVITDVDGSNPQTVSVLDHIQPGFFTWSPDGTQIAFTGRDTSVNKHPYHIYVIHTDGSNLKTVADIGYALALSWGVIPSDLLAALPTAPPTIAPSPTRTLPPSKTPKPSSTPKS